MDRCSYFIKNRAMFGSFPTQEAVNELEREGVRFFINLTYNHEKKITPYKTNYEYINFPIPDQRTPPNWDIFAKFILQISKIIVHLKPRELVYIHCKGGHGRSGVVVACLLCYIFNMSPNDALEHTTKCHSNRSIMRDKWRKIGSPQTRLQKTFVHKFFEPLYFHRAYRNGYTTGFSNFSLHPVTHPDLGTFPTSEAAFHACKDPNNVEYVNKQKNTKTPAQAKFLGKKANLPIDWNDKKDYVMIHILRLKISQHDTIKTNLLNTGLRPIIEHTRGDSYWGDGGDGSGQNKLGKILTKLRNELYIKE